MINNGKSVSSQEQILPPLGINTSFAAKNGGKIDIQSPEFIEFIERRRLCFFRLRNVRGIFLALGQRKTENGSLTHPLEYHRTGACKYCKLPHLENVNIKLTSEGKAIYGNLMTCGDVWVCPLCSAVIQNGRIAELEKLMSWVYSSKLPRVTPLLIENDTTWKDLNKYWKLSELCSVPLQALMVTYTIPHYSDQSCQYVLESFVEAVKRCKSYRAYKDGFKAKFGYVGSVKALEVRWGYKNGWHVHCHELVIVRAWEKSKDKYYTRIARGAIRKPFKQACDKVGIEIKNHKAFDKRAIDVRSFCHTSDYLQKTGKGSWGVEKELVRNIHKHSSGLHPFNFIDKYAHFKAVQKNAKSLEAKNHFWKKSNFYMDLYAEYITAFRNRHQLVWSPGLKSLAGVRKVTDQELAEQEEKKAMQILFCMPLSLWKTVRKDGKLMMRLLEHCERNPDDGLLDVVAKLGITPSTEKSPLPF